MLSEQRYVYDENRQRPWTVPALVGLGVLTYLIAQVFDVSFGVEDRRDASFGGTSIFRLLLSALFYWGLWNGRRWAYVLTIIGTMISAVAAISLLIFAEVPFPGNAWLVFLLAAEIYLLFHPATRAYFRRHPEVLDRSEVDKLTG